MSKLPYNVDDQQITRAKNQLKAQLLFAQDSPSGEALFSYPHQNPRQVLQGFIFQALPPQLFTIKLICHVTAQVAHLILTDCQFSRISDPCLSFSNHT